ncbi:hypothetical protein LTR91_018565 [Friedmanniomyces endolithicus]|uniref:Serine-rich protein n=1 Tax=Friedmanniomyces endolithicus TaxID=329885 RepID=A0AAN6HD55_9PEZI|nr:hypothetical protein LTR35_014290 [Friedmanniomyces endolithicus]KAK0272585.1 hypothetical protein LTS00_016177 [Friedmanniomyces endolithicus]KAK0900537.1 hypothetical protein LTR57_020582 [Friedmanniomyces endolithicus]KAK0964287.1 hypothetical protein LTR91_018565 [Friedmanniomyces endolithicus]KAK0965536.1 hypothetical protein LTS01_018256 [Friedmanniomyces endolithicus]
MFLDPEPNKRQKAISPSPFLPPPMPGEGLDDQRWRVKRKPLHERTKSQNNEQGQDANPGKPTIRLVRHSPTPSIHQRSSVASDVDYDDIKLAKRISLKRYNSGRALARLSHSADVVPEASAALPGHGTPSPDASLESVSPLSLSTNEAQTLQLPPSVILLPKSTTHAVPKTAWHRRSGSSGNYSTASTLRDGEHSLLGNSRRSERLSQGTTLRGTPTPYELEQPKSIEEEEGSGQGPAHALQTLQEASPERTTIRAVPPSVASTTTDDHLGSGPSETSLASPLAVSLPSVSDDPPTVPPKSSRRPSSTDSIPAPLSIRKTSSPPTPHAWTLQDARSDSVLPEPSSPVLVVYDSDSSRPRSRSQSLRYTSSLESIQSRLQQSTVRPQDNKHDLANSTSWSSLRPDSSTDTLESLQVLKKRSNHRPTSLSLGSSSAFASGSRMAAQDYDTLPYPRHQHNSYLSTIASESDQQSRSTSRQLSHFSLGSGVLTADDASSIPISGTWPRGRQEGELVESTASDASPAVSGGDGQHEPGDMTLGIFRDESAKPQPLFKPRSPSAPGEGRRYDGPLPPIPPIPKSRDSDENWDTVSELQTPSLRPKRSGYSLRQRSNSTPSRSNSHSRQISQISTEESERWSHASSLFPTWAKHFYGGTAALLSSSKVSLGTHNTPRPTRIQHGRTGSQWTERSVASRLGTGYSEIETGSPTSSRFLPSIFRPRTRVRADTDGGRRSSNLRRSKRSRPSADTDGRPDSLAIFNDPLPESRNGAVLPSGQPKWGELKEGSPKEPLEHRRLPRSYSKQKHYDQMQFPRPMTKDRLSDFALEQHPHLTPSKRHSLRISAWRPPSFVESLDTLIHSRCNRQILLFALGFVCPLLWMLGAALPLPRKPLGATDAEKQVGGGSEEDVQMAMMKHEAGDAEKRWREEKEWLKARWWRTLNRVMSLVGLLVIGAVIALAVVATR